MIKELSFRGAPYKIECSDSAQVCHPSWYSFDDESAVRDRDWLIRAGDVVLDIGAAYGSYALTALASGAARVYCWSPQGPPDEPTEAEMLRRSLALNGWTDRCTIYESGLFDKTGFLNASTQDFNASDSPPPNADQLGGEILRVECLDDWWARNHIYRADWMKLDVEGAEVEVLRGGEALIRELQPTILVENHLFKRATLGDEVRELLAGFGYNHVCTHPYHSISHSVYRPGIEHGTPR